MKVWAIFGILLITAMGTFIPCCTTKESCVEACIGLTNDTESPEDSPCSPFFACAGCAGFVSISKNIVFLTPLPLQKVYDDYHASWALPHYASLCWQPPRASLI